MEMSCPSSGPTEDAPFQHFPNSKSRAISVCEQEVTLTWLFVWRRPQVQALGQVQGRERVWLSCTNWSTCNETGRNVKKKNMSMMTVMTIRTGLGAWHNAFTHMFLIFFTKALADLTILLIRTCQRQNREVSKLEAGLSVALWRGFFKRVSGVVTLLTCCFLYKRGMEKTAITAVQQK